MRIGLETLSCDNKTGIGRIVRALAAAFTVRGHEVHIFTHDAGQVDGFVHVHRVMGFPRSKAVSKLLFRVGEKLRLQRLQCDVIYSFGVGRAADVVAAQSCHRAGMEILQSHSLAAWERPNLGLYDLVSLNDEKTLLTSARTKRIIACSNLVKGQIVQHYGVDPTRIEVIPNGIAPHARDRRNDTSIVMRKRCGIAREEKVLFFMGNEFARKGLQTVLEAVARLAMPGLRLLVAGGGNIQPYENLTQALRLAGKVTFLGSVNDPELWFDVADLFIFPTLYEPFGMVILEAMAAGVPVITSRSCGATEGMTHGLHGIFLDDPTSAGEVAEWIRTLLGDEGLRRRLSAAGRDIASQFCWDALADRTIEVLDSVRMERRGR